MPSLCVFSPTSVLHRAVRKVVAVAQKVFGELLKNSPNFLHLPNGSI